MLPVRVFFKKYGSAAYISHLDLQRAVVRAINRSGITPCYTEGFNPHIKLNFASPLSVYQKSEYEIFDFFTSQSLSYDEITQKLASAFPEGLEVYKTASPVKKLAELTSADYRVVFETNHDAKFMEEALSHDLTVIKKSKKGPHPEDLSHLIYEKSFSDENGKVVLNLKCACGSNDHLNVKYILDYLENKGISVRAEITRLTMRDKSGNLLI